MRTLTLLGAVLVALLLVAADDSKAMFAKHWQTAKEFTMAVAEAMPTEGYDFKPNPDELSFGQLMIHIASQNSDSCASATGTKALAEPAATDRQTAIKFLTDTLISAPRSLRPCIGTVEQGGLQIPRPAGACERGSMVYVHAYGSSSRTSRSLSARKEHQAASIAILENRSFKRDWRVSHPEGS